MQAANVTLQGMKSEADRLKRLRNWRFILEHPEMPADIIHPTRSTFVVSLDAVDH